MFLQNNLGFFEFSIFKKFPEIVHGITTMKFGNMKPTPQDLKNPKVIFDEYQRVVKNLTNFSQKLGISRSNFATPQQIHSGRIKKIEFASSTEQSDYPFIIGSADGLVTDQKGIFLFVAVADCFPILAYDPVKKIIGIAHAGWRGLKAGIGKNLISKMTQLSANPKNIIAGTSPGICSQCYEVKKDVASKFNKKFLVKRNGKMFLDLEKAIIDQLIKSGVEKEDIEEAGICVFENKNFFSFRRDQTEDRFAALIGLR